MKTNLFLISALLCCIPILTLSQQTTIEGKPGDHSLVISDAGNDAILIDSAETNGITIFNPGSFGIQINNPGLHGISLNSPNFIGMLVDGSGFDGLRVNNAGDNGLRVSSPNNNGIYVTNAGNAGIQIDNATNGLSVNGTTGAGIILSDNDNDGIVIFNPENHGININNAGLNGVTIADPNLIGYHVSNPGSDGFFVTGSLGDGLEVSGGQRGVYVHEVMTHAGYFQNSASATTAPLYLQRGDDSKMDLEFSGHARITSNGAYVIYLDDNDNSNNQFEVVDSDISTLFQVYESGNAYIKNQLRILNSNTNAIRLENSATDGINILSPGQDGVEVSGGVNGIYVHDVSSRAGHFDNAASSNIAPLYVAHGDDSKPDISFGGHALMTSNGDVDITLDANNNSNDVFTIRNSNGVPIFLAYEQPVECVSRGKLSAVGDITSNADLLIAGNGSVNGNLSKGGGSFKIDHPLDPENKFLYHSFVESPDMMNVYNGNTTTDENGISIIVLPDWFDALNRDFRYQLTTIGSFAQVMIKEELNNNQFSIQSSAPHTKVSWQITGIRQDPYANENRIQVEVPKTGDERGTYLHPEARRPSFAEHE